MKIAITQIGNKNWIGGNTYLKNLSGIIKTHLNNKIDLYLISCKKNFNENIKKNFKEIFFYKKKFYNFFFYNFKNICKKIKIDIFFESTEFLGFFVKGKVITWLPDFQHKYYPEYFSIKNLIIRELSYIIKIRLRDRILVSSQTAKKDCIKFYNVKSNKIFLAPFSINLMPKKYLNKEKYLMKKYDILKNYFFIPNQFWKHKNHNIILDLIDKLYNNKKIYNKLPQFIFSGLALDYRNNKYSQTLHKRINSKKYKDKVKYLGLIPLEDVYKLNANCLALINPSFFEGWSTTVEEAKSLGTPLILSNIPVHKEQAPNAIFFNPNNVKDFECSILKFLRLRKKIRNLKKINKFLNKRKEEFSLALKKAFQI